MSTTRVVGIDPGPTPGIVRLVVHQGQLVDVDVAQCNAELLWDVLPAVIGTLGSETRVLVAVERFVARGRASAEQRLTADQVTAVGALHPGAVQRTAAQVKPWATDERLERAGVLAAVKGMRHARDAGRHALYAAVKDAGLPDPLSASWQAASR